MYKLLCYVLTISLILTSLPVDSFALRPQSHQTHSTQQPPKAEQAKLDEVPYRFWGYATSVSLGDIKTVLSGFKDSYSWPTIKKISVALGVSASTIAKRIKDAGLNPNVLLFHTRRAQITKRYRHAIMVLESQQENITFAAASRIAYPYTDYKTLRDRLKSTHVSFDRIVKDRDRFHQRAAGLLIRYGIKPVYRYKFLVTRRTIQAIQEDITLTPELRIKLGIIWLMLRNVRDITTERLRRRNLGWLATNADKIGFYIPREKMVLKTALKLFMLKRNDLYSPDAENLVKRAHAVAVKRYHPDRNHTNILATGIMVNIDRAQNLLLDTICKLKGQMPPPYKKMPKGERRLPAPDDNRSSSAGANILKSLTITSALMAVGCSEKTIEVMKNLQYPLLVFLVAILGVLAFLGIRWYERRKEGKQLCKDTMRFLKGTEKKKGINPDLARKIEAIYFKTKELDLLSICNALVNLEALGNSNGTHLLPGSTEAVIKYSGKFPSGFVEKMIKRGDLQRLIDKKQKKDDGKKRTPTDQVPAEQQQAGGVGTRKPTDILAIFNRIQHAKMGTNDETLKADCDIAMAAIKMDGAYLNQFRIALKSCKGANIIQQVNAYQATIVAPALGRLKTGNIIKNQAELDVLKKHIRDKLAHFLDQSGAAAIVLESLIQKVKNREQLEEKKILQIAKEVKEIKEKSPKKWSDALAEKANRLTEQSRNMIALCRTVVAATGIEQRLQKEFDDSVGKAVGIGITDKINSYRQHVLLPALNILTHHKVVTSQQREGLLQAIEKRMADYVKMRGSLESMQQKAKPATGTEKFDLTESIATDGILEVDLRKPANRSNKGPSRSSSAGADAQKFKDYNEQLANSLDFICSEIFAGTITRDQLQRQLINGKKAYRHCFEKNMPLTLLFKPDIFLEATGYDGPAPYRIAITLIPDSAIIMNPIFSTSEKPERVNTISGVRWYHFKDLQNVRGFRNDKGLKAFLNSAMGTAYHRHLTTALWDTAFDGSAAFVITIGRTRKKQLLWQWAYSSTVSGVLGTMVRAKVSKDTYHNEMALINQAYVAARKDMDSKFSIAATGAYTKEQKGFSQRRMGPAARTIVTCMEMISADKAVAEHHMIDPDNKTVILKGLDTLGSNIVAQIATRYKYSGYKIIGVTDRNGGVFKKTGLDIQELMRLYGIIKSGKKVNVAKYYRGKVDKRYSKADMHELFREETAYMIVSGGGVKTEGLGCRVLIDVTEHGLNPKVAVQLQKGVGIERRKILFIPRILARGARVKLASEEYVHVQMGEIEPAGTGEKRPGLRRARQFLNRHFLDNITDVMIVNMLFMLGKYREKGFELSPNTHLREAALKIKKRKQELLARPNKAVKRRVTAYTKKGMKKNEALRLAASEIAREEVIFNGITIESVKGRIDVMDNSYLSLRNIEFVSRVIEADPNPNPKLKADIIAELTDIVQWSTRPLVKSAACESLGILADKQDSKVINALQDAVQDKDEHVRTWAVWAIERILGEPPRIETPMLHKRVQEYSVKLEREFEGSQLDDNTKKHITLPYFWQDWLKAEGTKKHFVKVISSQGTKDDIIVVRANFLRTGSETTAAEREAQKAVFLKELTMEIKHTYKHEFAVVIADDTVPDGTETGSRQRKDRMAEVTETIKEFIKGEGYDSYITQVSVMSTTFDLALLRGLSEAYSREARQIRKGTLPQSIFVTDTHGAIERVKEIIKIARELGVKEIIFNGDYFGKDGYPSFAVIDFFMHYVPEEGDPVLRFLAGGSEIIFVGGMLGDDNLTPIFTAWPECKYMREALNKEHQDNPSRYQEFHNAFPEGVTEDNYRSHPKMLDILEWMIENVRFTYYRDGEGVHYGAGTLSPDFEYRGLRFMQALDEMDREIKRKIREGHQLLRLMARIRISITIGKGEDLSEVYREVRTLVRRELLRNELYEREDIPNEMLLSMLEMLSNKENQHEAPQATYDILEGILKKKTRPLPPVFYRIWGAEVGRVDVDIVSPVASSTNIGGFSFFDELPQLEEKSGPFLKPQDYGYIADELISRLEGLTKIRYRRETVLEAVAYIADTASEIRGLSQSLQQADAQEQEQKQKAQDNILSYIYSIPNQYLFFGNLKPEVKITIVLYIAQALDREKVEKACLLFGISRFVYKTIFREDNPDLGPSTLEHCGVFRLVSADGNISDIYHPFDVDNAGNRSISSGEGLLKDISGRKERVDKVLAYYDIVPRNLSRPVFIKVVSAKSSAELLRHQAASADISAAA